MHWGRHKSQIIQIPTNQHVTAVFYQANHVSSRAGKICKKIIGRRENDKMIIIIIKLFSVRTTGGVRAASEV